MPRLGGSSASAVVPAGTEEIPFRNDTYCAAQDVANLSGAPAVTIEFSSDADLTLVQAQYQAESITFTDSPTTLTAGRAVVFPAHFPTKWVKNSTAQTLTLKKSGQTGVALAAGAFAIVASGAVDVVVGPGALAVVNVQNVTSAATITPTFSNEIVRATAQAAALAIANPTGTAIDGWSMVFELKDDGTARGLSFGTQYRGIGGALPTTTVAGKRMMFGAIYNAADAKMDVILPVAQEL